jgi:acyl carrier protein
MGNESDIERMVVKIVGDHLGIPGAALNLRTHITEELGADSLDRVELITTVEEYFEIEFPKETISEIQRIEDLVENVRLQAQKSMRSPGTFNE